MILKIKNLKAHTIIGVHAWEKEKSRDLIISVEAYFDGSKAVESDNITDTPDYDHISQIIIKETEQSRFDLIEKLADHLLGFIMEDSRISKVIIEIDKPGAVEAAESVSITAEKTR